MFWLLQNVFRLFRLFVMWQIPVGSRGVFKGVRADRLYRTSIFSRYTKKLIKRNIFNLLIK